MKLAAVSRGALLVLTGIVSMRRGSKSSEVATAEGTRAQETAGDDVSYSV